MAVNLIGADIKLMRKRYNEALQLQGIPCKYQFPLMAKSNTSGDPVVEAYSDYTETHIFFDGNPKMKTFKRYGWVVENDSNLPFLIHCSFDLPHVQKDSIFTIGGQYSELPDRIFRVTEITQDIQAPDHIICQVVPVYGDSVVGRTKQETRRTYSSSNHFLEDPTDYRGMYPSTQSDKK